MNSNAYNAGGAPAARPAAYFNGGAKNNETGSLREKLTFDPPRVPVILKPEGIPARSVDGKFGPQYRWEFEGAKVAWFDPDVHEEIRACLQLTNCTEVAITKHVRRGQPPRFEVQAVADETQPRETHDQLTARRIAEVKSQARPPRIKGNYEASDERETAPPANAMSSALTAAIVAASEVVAIANANAIDWKPTSEDIRALAITIYINEAKK